MKQPLDLECPVEGWTRHHIFEYVTVPLADKKSYTKIPVMIYVWKDGKGEMYLSGETGAYLDCLKANHMGLIDCDVCQQKDSCDSRMATECIKKSTTKKEQK
jgi:hypothetical protein